MYRCLMLFQVCCVFITGICLFLAASDRRLKEKEWGTALTGTLLGIFIMEAGYGLYLQTTGMEGLQVARKIYLAGKILAAVCLFMTFMSGNEKKGAAQAADRAAAVIGLTGTFFIISDYLQKRLFRNQSFAHNQIFYYIEEEVTLPGRLSMVCLGLLPVIGVVWFLLAKRNKAAEEKFLVCSQLLLCGAAFVCAGLPVFRHYDITMPLAAASAVCLVIFVAWSEKKVYTKG